jgi:hypothetical protein
MLLYSHCFAVIALKQTDPEPSAYVYNTESRLIRPMNRASLSGFSPEKDKIVILVTEGDPQGEDVCIIDELLALLEKERGMFIRFVLITCYFKSASQLSLKVK